LAQETAKEIVGSVSSIDCNNIEALVNKLWGEFVDYADGKKLKTFKQRKDFQLFKIFKSKKGTLLKVEKEYKPSQSPILISPDILIKVLKEAIVGLNTLNSLINPVTTPIINLQPNFLLIGFAI